MWALGLSPRQRDCPNRLPSEHSTPRAHSRLSRCVGAASTPQPVGQTRWVVCVCVSVSMCVCLRVCVRWHAECGEPAYALAPTGRARVCASRMS